MINKETLELLESVLNEAGARQKYLRNLFNDIQNLNKQAKETSDRFNITPYFGNIKNKAKMIKNIKKYQKTALNKEKKYNKYSTGNELIFNQNNNDSKYGENEKDTHEAGKRLKQSPNKEDAQKLLNSVAGKKAFMKDFSGPETEENTIDNRANKYGKNNNPKDIEKEKELLKERIEKVKKNHHIVGGYKLEAAYILIEALNTLLSE